MREIGRYIQLSFLLLISSVIFSQDLFIAEVGVHGGASYFMGDVQPKAFDVQPDFGATFRYLIDKRLSLQADYHHTYIQGDYNMKVENIAHPKVKINQELNVLDLVLTFNFLDYGKLDYLLNSSNHTFYLFAGTGLMHLHQDNSVHFSFPFGIGYKVKLSDKVHLNAQWTHRLMFADNIEGDPRLNNPLGINGTNFLNNDQLGTATIGLSIGILRRKCNCNSYY